MDQYNNKVTIINEMKWNILNYNTEKDDSLTYEQQ